MDGSNLTIDTKNIQGRLFYHQWFNSTGNANFAKYELREVNVPRCPYSNHTGNYALDDANLTIVPRSG